MNKVLGDKRFDINEFEKFDSDAKKVTAEFLNQVGFNDIRENEGESKRNFSKIWDISGNHSDLGEWRIEAEIKRFWGTKWGNKFPYTSMNIPYRKRNKAEEHATHHMIIGEDLNRFFIVERSVVLTSPVEEVWVRNRKGYENFYKVSVSSDCSGFWEKKRGKWNPI